jgi:hypothetical protein
LVRAVFGHVIDQIANYASAAIGYTMVCMASLWFWIRHR